jgi:hypothetical protein
MDENINMDEIFANGLCMECKTYGSKSGNIVGERGNNENKTELLIRWKDKSFRHTNWVAESWFGRAQPSTHKAYLKKKLDPSFEVASTIPIEWKTVDRILNVEWINKNTMEVKRVFSVMKDSNYDDGKYRTNCN